MKKLKKTRNIEANAPKVTMAFSCVCPDIRLPQLIAQHGGGLGRRGRDTK